MTRAARRSEAGQTTALVCAMLFTLAMFVALVVNVGQMVNRRVSLQLLADAGAWTGATVQAAQLNHYAYWSRMMQNAYVNASGISFGFRVSECYSGTAAVALYYYAAGGMTATGIRFANKAYDEAERHSKFNADDLFPSERDNFDYSTLAGPNEGATGDLLRGNIIPMPLLQGDKLYTGDHAWSRETLSQWPLELSVRLTKNLPWAVSKMGSGYEQWQCGTLLPPMSYPIFLIGPAGFRLQKGIFPYSFVWRVKEKQPTRALFFDRFFGPNAVPAMTAVAAAKPVGGDVHRGQSKYRAKMIPVSRYSLSQGIIQDSQARPGRIIPNPFRYIVH